MDLGEITPFIRYIQIHTTLDSYPSPVRAYDCRLLYCIHGQADICVDGTVYSLTAGTLMFFPPDTPYSLKAPSEQELQILFLNFDLIGGSSRQQPLPPASEKDYDPSLAIRPPKIAPLDRPVVAMCGEQEGKLLEILSEYQQQAPAFREKSASLLKCVLIDMVRHWSAPERQYPEAVRKALAYIRENFYRQLTNGEISAAAGYHPYYLDSCFCRCVGVPMRQYLIQYRISQARRMLLLTDGTIETVAESCGFSSPAYFSKCFRELSGETPGEYRRRERFRGF